MMKKLSIITALLLVALDVFGQTKSDLQFIEQTLENRGEIVLRFPHNGNRELVRELSHIMSIDKVNDTYVEAYANAREYEHFKTYGIEYEPVYEYYTQTRALNMANTVAQMANWDRYPTYAVYLELMRNYVRDYPTLCKMDTIGYSVYGRPIINMTISDNVGVDEDEPEFWWSSTMHGDETSGWYFLIRLVDDLLTNYGTDPQITNLVNNVEIYISPLTNPDGTFANSNDGTSISTATRYNYNSVDLNRNFPFVTNTASHTAAYPNEPEITMMTAYADAHNFVMSANCHGGDECMNYPWDEDGWTHARHPNPDDDWWEYVSWMFVDTVHAINANRFTGPSDVSGSNGVTKGSEWYSIDGGRQDYMNYYKHIKETTVEFTTTKKLGTENLTTYWGYYRKSILNYTEQVLYGFRGIVTDGCTNQPLTGVKVFINNHDADGTEVYTSAPIGNYHRPIYAGTYSVTFSKEGYTSQTFEITTQNMACQRLDVTMYPEGTIVPTFTANPTTLYEGNSVQFNNTTSGNYVSASWTFDSGSPATSTATSPTVTYNTHGTYDATLTIVNTNGCSASATEHITVYEAVPPVADFSASETYIMAENSVTFTDLSTNMPTSWSWTFEGGTPATSTEQNPTVTYSEAGEYTVTLVATNAFGSGTETKTEYISVAAVYNMSNETIYACGGTYKDPGGDGNYGNNNRYTQTIYPSTDGAYVRLTFTQLGLQQTTNWNTTTCNDYITIYDGTSTSATQIGQYCGTNPSSIGTNGVVTATNDDGALTIYFYSNNRTTNTGWEAEISCYVPEPEVAVQSYTPATARYGTTNDLSVTFVNNGGVSTSASTTATLSTTDEYITLNTAEQTIGSIAGNATTSTTFSFTVAENVPDGHIATINVAIADGNRTWNETLTITAIGPSCEQPTGLQVALNGTTVTITWDAQANTPLAISDDFEGHTYGTINSPGTVGWTYIDGDNTNTNQFSSISFTNEGSKMAFIVLDDEELTGSSANVNAHSGDKFIGAPYVSQNDDWIISPELNFTDDFTFSFFARSYSYNYTNEQFYAAYSTTGNSASDFMNLDDVTTTTTTWTEYSYTVPADAKYVAIHCVSTDVYMFCVDDINISGNVVSDVVVNLYDNGVLVASNVNGGTYTATGLSAGEHCFSIRAVCDDDSESLAAQSCVNVENIAPAPTYTITVNAGTGGSVSPNGPQTVNEGGNFTFIVAPNDCYEVSSVTVNGTPVTLTANNQYTINNITANQNVNATFSQISYMVTASAGNGGIITGAPTSVNCGEGYTFTVAPNDCYEVASVTVNGTLVTPTNNIYTIENVTEAQSINATFSLISYEVTASAGNGGTINNAPSSVNCGEGYTFTVTPNDCYEVASVTVNGTPVTPTNNIYTIANVTEVQSINATFIQISYTITASAGNGGIITGAPTSVNCGEGYSFTVTPNDCYEVASVTVNGTIVTSTNNIYTIANVTEAQSINATFSQISYTVTASAGNGGTITGAPASVNCGEGYTFTVTPNDCYEVASVTVNGTQVTPTNNIYTISNVTEAQSINAAFNQISYTITASAGNGGTINGAPTSVNCGGDYTFTVTPNDCYEVASVTVNGTPVTPINNTYTIANVTAAQSINATFSRISYTITASAGNGGTISNAGSTTVNCGDDITYTITANEGYMISDVLVDGQSVGSVSSYQFTNVIANHTISATFELIPAGEVVIVVNADAEGGSVDPTGTQTLTEGDDFTFTVTPDNCHTIGIVTVNGAEVTLDANNSYTIPNVTTEQTINVTFNQISYTVAVDAGEGGTITPADGAVLCGENITFAIAPNEGYEIVDVVVDGQSRGVITSYTFENVTDNEHSIAATFSPIEVVLDCNAVTNLSVRVESYGIVLSWETVENAISYEIYHNGNWISTSTGTSYIDLQGQVGDTYYIITNCANGGTSDASETATAIVTGISEAETSIDIFPNPANDILNITSSETISEIEIVNTLGQVVYRAEVNSDNAVCDVEGLANGVYVVRIRTLRQAQGAIVPKKFIKE